jgi:hypothetical protein
MPVKSLLALARAVLITQLFWGAGAIASELPARFGSVYRINGSISAVDATTGSARELRAGDVLNVGDQIRAAPNGEALVRTDDAGFIAVRPNSSFTMERFSAKNTGDEKLSLRIFSGALRLITGWIGSRRKDNYQIVTATATIGIRGTDHEPYVLSTELAAEHQQPEGTYNKVNKGGTSLTAAGARISIDAGQVGFAPSLPADRTRSLMTVLMPVLLERVPSFFVAGMFDAELDQLTSQALPVAPVATGASAPSSQTTAAPVPAGPQTDGATAPQAPAAQSAASSEPPQNTGTPSPNTSAPAIPIPGPSPCRPKEIAEAWLELLDSAVTQRNPQLFVDMFAQHAKVTAQVRDGEGKYIEFVFTRNELAKSTFASLNRLTQFESRRISIKATPGANSTPKRCNKVVIESVVLESGVRDGQRYRIESTEKFTIESTAGGWLAVDASTKQR